MKAVWRSNQQGIRSITDEGSMFLVQSFNIQMNISHIGVIDSIKCRQFGKKRTRIFGVGMKFQPVDEECDYLIPLLTKSDNEGLLLTDTSPHIKANPSIVRKSI